MPLGKGHASYVLIATESTYGVAPANGYHKVEVVSVSCDPVIGMIPDTSLYSARARRGLYQGGLMYRGTMRIRANYEGAALLHLLRCAHLAGATGAGTGYLYQQATAGPPAANNHTFTDGSTLRSLTMQMQEGGVASTVQQVTGLVITGYSFRISPGTGAEAMGMYEFTYVAKDKTEGITEIAGGNVTAFATANPVLFHHCTVQVDGSGSTGNIRSLELSYEVPMSEDRFTLGTINPLQPIPSDFVNCSVKFTREFDSLGLFTKAKGFEAPAAALNFKFVGGTIVAGHTFEQEFTVANARLQDYSNPIDDYGVLVANATWLAYDNGGESLKVRVKNSAASLG